MYRCVCHTCEEAEIVEEFDRAQEYFNDHADRLCEVELHRVTATSHPTAGSPDATADETRPVHD